MTGIPVDPDELVDVDTINSWARGYFRKTTAKTVAGTTTATDLLNGEFTLPAGALSTDRILRLTAWGDWKQNSGAARDFPRFQLILDSTTLIDTDNSGVAAASNVATRWGWRVVCEIQNLGAANSQWATFTGRITYGYNADGVALFATGEGMSIAWPTGSGSWDGGNAGAVDTTAACALILKVINANNSANYETKLYGALVEII